MRIYVPFKTGIDFFSPCILPATILVSSVATLETNVACGVIVSLGQYLYREGTNGRKHS